MEWKKEEDYEQATIEMHGGGGRLVITAWDEMGVGMRVDIDEALDEPGMDIARVLGESLAKDLYAGLREEFGDDDLRAQLISERTRRIAAEEKLATAQEMRDEYRDVGAMAGREIEGLRSLLSRAMSAALQTKDEYRAADLLMIYHDLLKVASWS